MTALTLALVAGMAVASDGQERISLETEQRLAIDGYWEGNMEFGDGETSKVKLEAGYWNKIKCGWTDEGQGRCLCFYGPCMMPGIYKQEAGELFICFAYYGDRPTRFHAGGGDRLLILKPAKPPKK